MSKWATIDFQGDFFKVTPGETLLKNVEKMMQGIADEGATAARANLSVGSAQRAPVSATGDRVADHVIGRTVSRSGRQWMTAAVVQVDNSGMDAATSRSLMAAASRIEGRSHAVRKVASQIRSGKSVLTANLSAGME